MFACQFAEPVDQTIEYAALGPAVHAGIDGVPMTDADDFSHECASISVDWDISGQRVTRLLDQAAIATWRQDYNEVRPTQQRGVCPTGPLR